MKDNKKKILYIIIPILIVLLLLVIVFINNTNKNNLTLEENKWIQNNKHNVIDVAVLNDIPVLAYNGKGMVYNYLKYISENYDLNFNVIAYKTGSTSSYDYKFELKDDYTDKDIVILKDSYVLITQNKKEYTNIDEIKNINIGILKEDASKLKSYLTDTSLNFIELETINDLKNTMLVEQVGNDYGILIPKTVFTKDIIENGYVISYQFNDINKYYCLSTGNVNELNGIFKKSYNLWKEENYLDDYNEELLDNYFAFNNISDVDKKTLMSKSYVYGFVNYGIYNSLNNGKISGLNSLILKGFNNFSNISITYTQYNNISRLINDFNQYKVDFMFNLVPQTSYSGNIYNTVGVFNKELVILTDISNTYTIDNIYSLKDKEVSIVKDTYLESYLREIGAKTKSYNNLKELVSDMNSSTICIMDLENYNYYKSSKFKDSKINSVINEHEKYNYVINNTQENLIFKDLFNFYLNYTSINNLISLNYKDIAYKNINIVYILVFIIVVLFAYLVFDCYNHIKSLIKNIKKNKKVNLSKADKLKYIDQLTSLKNRAYLNSKIESWDESEVYPQSIIIVDLNNISYINDNYGREEGDKVITEAANILIMNQLQNSEIIRTDGNEFLIYLVGYSEKQVISYLRKLNKELKGLSHGFGAASGYSIIEDAIKTIDDAVNEATLDMKNNKEDIDY